MKKNILIITSFVLFLFACSPSNNAIQTAIAQTQAAFPTNTKIPAPPTFSPTLMPTTQPTKIPAPRVLLPVRGLYVQFERRGFPYWYWSGDVINDFYKYDDLVGHTVAEEVALQLDKMKEMGVNTITFELRSSDAVALPGPYVPPTCNIAPALGLQYPKPTPKEITNLVAFLDLLQSKDMKLFLRLVNIHMEEQPPTNNELWLGTILTAIKDHPALDLVLFEGSAFLIDTTGDGIKESCGVPAEPGLWLGSTSIDAQYIRWAIDYGHSLRIPYRKLSAEAIVGDYYSFNQGAAGLGATDLHQWDPVATLKGIFDSLRIPDDQRTYAISFHEHRKCSHSLNLPCVDKNPHAWALETVDNLFNVIGRQNGARVVVPEMSALPPVENTWTTEMALESLIWIFQNYGIDGGSFWRWTDFYNDEELDKTLQTPIKQRGVEFNYNPVKDFLEQLYTRGQTDDLDLTPDSLPPVFSSINVNPALLRNGDTFKFTANLGETHLFVSADISDLDPSYTNPITLLDAGDGTYSATASLKLWNTTENGTKTVRMKAMDFWSNITTTSVQVDLQNPPPILDAISPSDHFRGTALDRARWTADTAGGASVTQNDILIVSTDDKVTYSSAMVSSNWGFPGDFDIQIDFRIGEGWEVPLTGHLDGADLTVNIAGQSYRITRLLGNDLSTDTIRAWDTTGVLTEEMNTHVLTGKFRLMRVGTMLYLLYDIGEGWQKLASTRVPSDAAQVSFGCNSVDGSLAFTTYYDNFQVNSGLTNYQP